MDVNPSPPSPYLDLVARLDAAEKHALATVDRLTHAARRRRPSPDKWCVDEILDHIAITTRSYEARMAKALEAARKKGSRHRPGLRHTLLGNFLISALKPGSKPVSSPGAFRPKESKAGESASHDALGKFKAANGLLREWLAAVATIESSRAKVSSPAFALFRLNLDDVVVSLVMHVERHVQQIDRTAA